MFFDFFVVLFRLDRSVVQPTTAGGAVSGRSAKVENSTSKMYFLSLLPLLHFIHLFLFLFLFFSLHF